MQESKESKDTEEIWKDIKDYGGRYQVSSEGRIKSVERDIICKNGVKRHVKERILKPQLPSGYSYPVVNLEMAGIYSTHSISKLVCNAFTPKAAYEFKIKYLNKIITDNQIPWNRPVGYYVNGELIKTFSSVTEAAQQFGFTAEEILFRIRRLHGLWKYVED